MTDQTDAPEGAAASADIGHYPFVQSVPTPEGVGKLLEVVREHVEDTLIPRLTRIEEPGTGTIAFAVASGGGIAPLPSSIFDEYRDAPLFRRGVATMTSLDSFIAHVNRFGDADSAVFADDSRTAPRLTAVLDYHRADTGTGITHGEYRHGKHRTAFAFPLSDEWKAWTEKNEQPMKMATFAAFIEKRIGDIDTPGGAMSEQVERFVETKGGAALIADYATLVTLSRGLKVYESAVVEEAITRESGEGHIRFTTDHTTKTGLGDTIRVPTMFFIAIPIFRNGAPYRMPVGLAYRKTAEGIVFWYEMHRADLSFDHAFKEAIDRVANETTAAVFFGAPEG